MHNYDYAMEIIGEENGYALVKDNGYCNVYDPNGQPVFKKDRVYSNDYFREVTILYDDMLIADYNTGEIFDMQGNPVNNFSTRFNLYYHKNSDIVNLFIFTVVPLVIFLLWYFLLWIPFKKRNTLTKGMKTTFSLLMLLIVIAVALFASIITFMFITREHNVVIKNNFQYDIKEIEDDNGGTTKKLVWYNKDENTNVIVREFKNSTSEGSGLDIGFSNTDSYVVVNDGNLSNVYGPEGKPVFEKDLEDADLLFVDDGLLISDRHSGKYYDLKGKPVKNFYTDMDWFLYNNGNLLLCGMTLLFLVIGFILWFFLSWRRRKIQ